MSQAPLVTLRARGAAANPPNRFERLAFEPDAEACVHDPADGDPSPVPTVFLRDPTRSILASNDSPDVGFDYSINVYRGCEHGCSYCFARPTHEFLGFSAGLDFETRIVVKEDAPALLREALSKRSWRGEPLGMSGVTDPYQPVERRLRLTRRCLEVLVDFRNPVAVITKSYLVARDADLLGALAEHGAAGVSVSITTLDPELRRVMEPRASAPSRRLDAIRTLARAGVPAGALIGPVIPGLNDHEIPRILEAAADAGATFAGYVMLRLPHGLKELFTDWLERHLPERKSRILHRVQDVRGGALYDSRYGVRGRGTGLYADHIERLFDVSCRKYGLSQQMPPLSSDAFRRPAGAQLALFE